VRDLGPLLVQHRLLLGDLGIEVDQHGVGHRDVGHRLVHRHPVLAFVDAGQHLAGPDRLVVMDQDLDDIP